MPILNPRYTDLATVQKMAPDLVNNQGAPVTMLEQAIGEAAAIIDGYISRRYTLPITVTVPLLTTLATDIAVFRVLSSKPFSPAERSVDTNWPDRYREAIAILTKIAEGDMALVGVDGTVVTANDNSRAWSTTMNYVPTFGESADQGFVVDRNKTEAEDSRRP